MNEGQSLKPREQSSSRERGTLKSAASGLAGKFRILSLAVLGATAVAAQACDSDTMNQAEDQCYLDNDPTKPCPLGTGANGTGGTNEGGAGTAGNGNGGTGANEGGSAGNGNGGTGANEGGSAGNGNGGTGANEGGSAGNGNGGNGGSGLDGGAGQGGTAGQGGGIDGGAGQGGTAGQGGGIDGGAGQGGTAGQGGGIDGGAGQGGTAGTGGLDGGAGAGGDGGGQVGDNCVNHYSCEGNLLCCNDVCVNQTTQNCGECGVVCNGGTPFCIESVGQCTAGCAGQYLDCGDHICRDSYNDNMNCGGCDNVCDAPKTCQTGFCKN